MCILLLGIRQVVLTIDIAKCMSHQTYQLSLTLASAMSEHGVLACTSEKAPRAPARRAQHDLRL